MLSDGEPKTFREIHKQSKLTRKAAEGAIRRLWRRGFILRTKNRAMKQLLPSKGEPETEKTQEDIISTCDQVKQASLY